MILLLDRLGAQETVPTADRLADLLADVADQLERGDEVHGNGSAPDVAGAALRELLPTVRNLLALGPVRDTDVGPTDRRTDPALAVGAAVEPAPGRSLGEYRLLEEIGRGGMGVVFAAEQLGLGRIVAVKILTSTAAMDERRQQRFEFEARTAASLNHPHIVPVYAVGVDAGTLYYVMPLVRGVNLSRMIACQQDVADRGGVGNPIGDAIGVVPPPRTADYHRYAARLIATAADALEHAHAAGVVHRDIKPGNLLVEPAGRVWVSDFGLAAVRGGDGLTATGEVVGTARYMSPEQTSGLRGLVDARSDVYSLGITLYELLALRPAFDGPTADVFRRIASEPPPPLRRFDRGIPRDLLVIVNATIEKNPADRYQSAAALAADLNRFLRGEPILARPPTSAELFRRWSFRHRGRLAVVTAASVLLCIVSAIAWRTTDSALVRERQANARAEQRLKESHAIFESTVLTVVADDRIHDAAFEELRQRFMTKGADYLERFTRDHADDPALCTQMACAVEQLGEIRSRQTRKEDARQLFQEAVRRYEQLIQQTDGPMRAAYLDRRTALVARLGGDGTSPPGPSEK